MPTNLNTSQPLQLRVLPRRLDLLLSKLHSPLGQDQAWAEGVAPNLWSTDDSQSFGEMDTCSLGNGVGQRRATWFDTCQASSRDKRAFGLVEFIASGMAEPEMGFHIV